jgi:ABC-2 type transport system permease protein
MEKNFIKPIPSVSEAFQTLLSADFRVQWRQRRSLIMSIIVPIIFLISWKSLIPVIGGPEVLSICMAVGLPAVGLMGYSLTIARDRERGIFQRLRAAPVPTWIIMSSRLIVQLVVIAAMALVTIAIAGWVDKISIAPLNIVLLVIASLIGGMSFLALGQFIVAFIQSSEAVNSAARLIYFPIAIVGALGSIGIFGKTVANIVTWSPLGTTKVLLVAAMEPSTIFTHDVLFALAVTLGYGLVFAGIGIRYFKWTGRG